MLVPNIINITYGRGVGYTFEEEVFDTTITDISATKIRKQLREDGKLLRLTLTLISDKLSPRTHLQILPEWWNW